MLGGADVCTGRGIVLLTRMSSGISRPAVVGVIIFSDSNPLVIHGSDNARLSRFGYSLSTENIRTIFMVWVSGAHKL